MSPADNGTKLNVEPCHTLQRYIVSHFWRKAEESVRIDEYVAYFYHYNSTCRALYLGAVRTESAAIALKTHEDVLAVVDTIWSLFISEPDFSRPMLRARLQECGRFLDASTSKVDNSINLVFRLWLTIRIQEEDFAPASKTIQWDDNSSFKNFFLGQFPSQKSHAMNNSNVIMFESDFTAVNLNRMCGIHIEWTHHLEDHLRFDIDRRVLMIYTLARTLRDHIDSTTIMPSSLARETLTTLSILFPNWDLRTEQFLRHAQNTQLYHHSVEYPAHISLNDFLHWRDRLARIHHEFQSPGPGWRHLWEDRRNPLQWYTFWFAVAILVLTIVFGTASLVLTSLQTWYAYQSLLLARMQQLE